MSASDRQIAETIERDGWPHHHVVVTWPEGVWTQANGKPGHAHFDIYKVISCQDSGALLYERDGEGYGYGVTEDLREAIRLAEGDVKWDGCVNYAMGEFDGNRLAVMLHACGAADLTDLFAAVQRAYVLAAGMVGAEECAV